jgi:uncharacterized protein (TIGR02118 family)
MIKVVAPANMHPGARTLEQFHGYWRESHGPLFSNTKAVRRYVQHLTLPEAYGGEPSPTFDGVSMFWYDDFHSLMNPSQEPENLALREAVFADDRQLFNRLPGWPAHHKRASVVAEEKVIVDGQTASEMVKGIFIASKLPGLTLQEFFEHWHEVHGPLGAKIPGLRRYVQNHALIEAYSVRPMTHDGWSELWFDDLESLQRAVQSPEWQALREDGATLFAQPMGIGIAREIVQKEVGWQPPVPEVASWDEERIRQRLLDEGYESLAKDSDAAGKIKAAAAAGALAVWTWEHLVTIDASRIDARPEKRG